MLPPPLFWMLKSLYFSHIQKHVFLVSLNFLWKDEKHRETNSAKNLIVRALLSTFEAANQNPI